jgi:hypothetical protein
MRSDVVVVMKTLEVSGDYFNAHNHVGFHVLTAVLLDIPDLWIMAPCRQRKRSRKFCLTALSVAKIMWRLW